MRSIADLPASAGALADRVRRIWPMRSSSSIAQDSLPLPGREREGLDDLRLTEGGRPLRLEGELAEPRAM